MLFYSVAKSCPTPMDCSTLGSSVLHFLPEFAQIHVCLVGEPYLNISSSAAPFSFFPLSPSARVKLFSSESDLCIRGPKSYSFSTSISPSNEWSGLISLGWTGWISLLSKGLSRVFSCIIIQKHQFLVLNLLYSPTLISIGDYWRNSSSDHTDLVGKVISSF